MSFIAVLPAAAVLPERDAARRHAMRAVRVLLLLAGLTMLGLALGAEAQAAERPGAERVLERAVANEAMDGLDGAGLDDTALDHTALDHTVLDGTSKAPPADQRQPISPGAPRSPKLSAEPLAPVEPARATAGHIGDSLTGRTAAAAVVPVVEQAVAPFAVRVVEPVNEAVAEPLGRAVATTARTAGQPVAGRALPDPAARWPGDGQAVPVPAPTAVPVSVPGQKLAAVGSAVDRPGAKPAIPTPATRSPDVTPRMVPPGPPGTFLADASHGHGGRLPLAPGRAPAGPGGSAVLQAVGDGHTHRAGDPEGVWSSRGATFVLIRGSRQPADEAGLRERHRDILEFPG
ncbi:hypothetical protein [Streptomyces sp. NPDC127084]|uniref:hypothetical protein n=1 Tax=Streptomyces sp. NPDC127084 TaxID=3347133 RepID=UPI00365E72A1